MQMDWINEYNIYPGVYEHYKGNLYVVQNIITHSLNNKDEWVRLQDPLVVYRPLEQEYKDFPVLDSKDRTKHLRDGGGNPRYNRRPVIKTFQQPLSRFLSSIEIKTKDIKRHKGGKKLVPRFKMA